MRKLLKRSNTLVMICTRTVCSFGSHYANQARGRRLPLIDCRIHAGSTKGHTMCSSHSAPSTSKIAGILKKLLVTTSAQFQCAPSLPSLLRISRFKKDMSLNQRGTATSLVWSDSSLCVHCMQLEDQPRATMTEKGDWDPDHVLPRAA